MSRSRSNTGWDDGVSAKTDEGAYLNELLDVLRISVLSRGALDALPRIPVRVIREVTVSIHRRERRSHGGLRGMARLDATERDSPFRLANKVKHARAGRVDVANGRCGGHYSISPTSIRYGPQWTWTNPACSTCRTARTESDDMRKSGGNCALVTRSEGRGGREGTHEELLVLGGLDGALLGEALDDGDGFVELCLGHCGSR